MIKSRLVWEKELVFAVEQDKHKFYLDGDPQFGGQEKGPRPKGLLLTALGGCSGMDAVSILTKMRVGDFELKIDINGDIEEEYPKAITGIELIFKFKGDDIPESKLKRAVELATEKYCAAYAMLSKAAKIETKILLNGEEVK